MAEVAVATARLGVQPDRRPAVTYWPNAPATSDKRPRRPAAGHAPVGARRGHPPGRAGCRPGPRSAVRATPRRSVEEIADAARVTKGAVYHHFASKEALFRAVYAEVEAEAQARTLEAGDPQAPPVEQIVAKVNAYLDAALDEEIRRITLIDGPALLGFEPDEVADQQQNQAGVRAFIAASIANGQLADLDPDVLTQLLGGLAWVGGLLIAHASDPDTTRASLGQALDVMLRGLAPSQQP